MFRKLECNHFQVPSSFSKIVIHTIPDFHKSAFQCLFCLNLHDFTPFTPKILWGRTPRPPPPPNNCDITNTFYNVKCVWVRRKHQGRLIFMKRYCPESCSRINTEVPYPPPFVVFFLFFFFFFFFFFLLVKFFFGKLDPPLWKFLDPRLHSNL